MSGNDERLDKEQQILLKIAERKEQAIPIRNKIKRLIALANDLKISTNLHNMKFGNLKIVQLYEIGTDEDLYNYRRWMKRYEVYYGRFRKKMVMDFDDDDIYRYIAGEWTAQLDDYIMRAESSLERKRYEVQQRRVVRRIEDEKYLLRKEMEAFGIE